jgi:NAD(P)-dependent dehydrogenase (short-subunit alcohol dehydrogenase family)
MATAERVAVVTGAGSGIGREVALRLGAAGAAVALVGRRRPQLELVQAELERRGARAAALPCDVAEPASVRDCAAAARAHFGAIAILVNSAGVATSAPLERTSDEEWSRALAVNASGPFWWLREVAAEMRAAGWGRIVTIASTAGRHGTPYIAAYAASKHAAVGLTRAAAAELAGAGVTVNAVCPGFVETDMTRASIENIVGRTGRSAQQARASLERFSPQRRLMSAAEVAATVCFLCGEEAAGINGQAVVIDGGGVQA